MGAPVPKGRPRLGRYGTYTPQKTVEYEKLVRAEYQNKYKSPLKGSISACIAFYMPIPKSASKADKKTMLDGITPHTKKPDIDNMIKSVTDALNGLAYDDDSQITDIYAQKKYSDNPRVEIRLWENNA